MDSLAAGAADYDRSQSDLFQAICFDLERKSWSVRENALPAALAKALRNRAGSADIPAYKAAGIGRSDGFHTNASERRDKISWIDQSHPADQAWCAWADALQAALNKNLYLGLNRFESHFSRYETGDFYRKHLDAFTGTGNRRISIVTYLNDDWLVSDGGALALYTGADNPEIINVPPKMGTIVIFLSTDIAHEVLVTDKTRYSIAGWYR